MSIATWETVPVIVIPNLDFNLIFFDNITTGLQGRIGQGLAFDII